jgi:hypothetical protein
MYCNFFTTVRDYSMLSCPYDVIRYRFADTDWARFSRPVCERYPAIKAIADIITDHIGDNDDTLKEVASIGVLINKRKRGQLSVEEKAVMESDARAVAMAELVFKTIEKRSRIDQRVDSAEMERWLRENGANFAALREIDPQVEHIAIDTRAKVLLDLELHGAIQESTLVETMTRLIIIHTNTDDAFESLYTMFSTGLVLRGISDRQREGLRRCFANVPGPEHVSISARLIRKFQTAVNDDAASILLPRFTKPRF